MRANVHHVEEFEGPDYVLYHVTVTIFGLVQPPAFVRCWRLADNQDLCSVYGTWRMVRSDTNGPKSFQTLDERMRKLTVNEEAVKTAINQWNPCR